MRVSWRQATSSTCDSMSLKLRPQGKCIARQIIAVIVAAVLEALQLDTQPPRVHGAAAGVPTRGALAHNLSVQPYGLLHLRLLHVVRHVLGLHPLQPVAGDLPLGLRQQRGQGGGR